MSAAQESHHQPCLRHRVSNSFQRLKTQSKSEKSGQHMLRLYTPYKDSGPKSLCRSASGGTYRSEHGERDAQIFLMDNKILRLIPHTPSYAHWRIKTGMRTNVCKRMRACKSACRCTGAQVYTREQVRTCACTLARACYMAGMAKRCI